MRRATGAEWTFGQGPDGVPVSGPFRGNNLLVLRDAALAGIGIARLFADFMQEALAALECFPGLARGPSRPVLP